MKHQVVLILVLLCLLPIGAQALTFVSGNQPVIDEPIDDDVFGSGGTVTVNAPVSSLTVAGGTVTVNAPVDGDVVAAGGTIIVNGDVGGKILAAGGTVEVNGNATNAVITGGTVRIGENAVIQRDAAISGGTVVNAGTVVQNLSVSASFFENPGIAGSVTFQEAPEAEQIVPGLGLVGILLAIGFFILGVVLLRLFPAPFSSVVREVESRPLIKTIVGFFMIIVSAVVILIIAITVIGLPVAGLFGLLYIAALLLSYLFVAYALGDVIALRFRQRWSPIAVFALGFIILHLLFLIPVVGGIIWGISISLGYGALLYAIKGARRTLSGGCGVSA